MKIKTGFMIRAIADTWLVVPLGAQVVTFNGLITLNDTGAFLWQLLEQESGSETLAAALAEAYEVAPQQAAADVAAFIEQLRDGGVLE